MIHMTLLHFLCDQRTLSRGHRPASWADPLGWALALHLAPGHPSWALARGESEWFFHSRYESTMCLELSKKTWDWCVKLFLQRESE